MNTKRNYYLFVPADDIYNKVVKEDGSAVINKNANEILENSKYYIKYTQELRGKFIYGDVFPKVQPIHLEIGMGKGNFIIDMALKHPDINFIGIERYFICNRSLLFVNDFIVIVFQCHRRAT